MSNVTELPLRPADGQDAPPKYSNARTTPASPRARVEKTPADGLGMWLKIQTAFSGASLLDATPPALLLIWERHCTAAKAWGKAMRGPRYTWGAVHVTMIAPVLYFLVWATDSPPKALGTLLTVATILLWFPHFTLTITL